MAELTCRVTQGSDDWDDVNSTDTTIMTRALRDPFGTPNAIESAYADITTSGIDASWTISSTVLHFYTVSNTTTPKGEPYYSYIEMHDGSSFVTIDSLDKARNTGWDSINLTSTEIGYINRSGKTSFKFRVPLSDTWGSAIVWSLKSYEDDPLNAPYLVVTYTAGSTTRRRAIIIS